MKKAKIMLMTIGVVGLIGGALAFKAARFFAPNVATCKTTVVGGLPFCSLIPYATAPNGNATITAKSLFTNAPEPGLDPVCISTVNTVNCLLGNAIPLAQSVYFNQ